LACWTYLPEGESELRCANENPHSKREILSLWIKFLANFKPMQLNEFFFKYRKTEKKYLLKVDGRWNNEIKEWLNKFEYHLYTPRLIILLLLKDIYTYKNVTNTADCQKIIIKNKISKMNILTTYWSSIIMYIILLSFVTDYHTFANCDIILLENR